MGIWVPQRQIVPALRGHAYPERHFASSVPAITGPTNFWRLDDGSGNPADDSAGSVDLTDQGAGSATGKIGNCRTFNGSNQYLTAPLQANMDTGDVNFAFGGWVNLAAKGSDRGIIGKWGGSGGQREYLLYFANGDDRFEWRVSNDGTASTGVQASTLGSPSLSTWYYLFCYHDATANEIGISVNNGTVNTASHTTGVTTNKNVFRMGLAAAASYWNGNLDAWAHWLNYIPTTQERTDVYNEGNGREYYDGAWH